MDFYSLEQKAKPLYSGNDSAHDWLHVKRVARLAKSIAKAEGADEEVAIAAAILHDCAMPSKSSKEEKDESPNVARQLLSSLGFPAQKLEPVCYAISAHSYSKGIVPQTLDAKVLQDADRLDALGAIGIARAFAFGASMKKDGSAGLGGNSRPFYDEEDPFCRNREPDDKTFTVDHFYSKLLLLQQKMNTETGRRLAKRRSEYLVSFLNEIEWELNQEKQEP